MVSSISARRHGAFRAEAASTGSGLAGFMPPRATWRLRACFGSAGATAHHWMTTITTTTMNGGRGSVLFQPSQQLSIRLDGIFWTKLIRMARAMSTSTLLAIFH